MNRFFADESNIEGGFITIDLPSDIHHMRDVLRLKRGAEVLIVVGEWEYECRIDEIQDKSIKLKICDMQKPGKDLKIRLTLYQGIPRMGKMDDTVRKVTELGVSAIVPVFMERTVVAKNSNFDKKVERMRVIAAESSKQSARLSVPIVSKAIDFETMLDLLKHHDGVIFCYEKENTRSLKEGLQSKDFGSDDVAVIIGPEGGFSDHEATEISKQGALPVSLGNTILRTETAGVVAVANILYELGS